MWMFGCWQKEKKELAKKCFEGWLERKKEQEQQQQKETLSRSPTRVRHDEDQEAEYQAWLARKNKEIARKKREEDIRQALIREQEEVSVCAEKRLLDIQLACFCPYSFLCVCVFFFFFCISENEKASRRVRGSGACMGATQARGRAEGAKGTRGTQEAMAEGGSHHQGEFVQVWIYLKENIISRHFLCRAHVCPHFLRKVVRCV